MSTSKQLHKLGGVLCSDEKLREKFGVINLPCIHESRIVENRDCTRRDFMSLAKHDVRKVLWDDMK